MNKKKMNFSIARIIDNIEPFAWDNKHMSRLGIDGKKSLMINNQAVPQRVIDKLFSLVRANQFGNSESGNIYLFDFDHQGYIDLMVALSQHSVMHNSISIHGIGVVEVLNQEHEDTVISPFILEEI